MIPVFYDTHAHLGYRDFEAELPEVIGRAKAVGIAKIVTIGTDEESSRKAVDMAETYENVYAAVGWHPCDAGEAPVDIRPMLRELGSHPKVVALGETGLDYYRLPGKKDPSRAGEDEPVKTTQLRLFQQHLEVAAECGLNCVIHQRDCFEETLAAFAPYAARVRGVFHCFAGDPASMQRVLALGSLVSFTGILTFKNGQNIRDTLAQTPHGSFMLETDSPFLAPIPYRGKRCEPAYVKEISETAAQVKGCSLAELSDRTCRTAESFFRNLA